MAEEEARAGAEEGGGPGATLYVEEEDIKEDGTPKLVHEVYFGSGEREG